MPPEAEAEAGREEREAAVRTPVLPFELLTGAKRLSRAQKDEARLFALSVVRDEQYKKNVLARARTGRLAPVVEVTIMAYAWGKPPERIEFGRSDMELSELSTEELAARAIALAKALLTPNGLSALAAGELQQRNAQEQTDAALRRPERSLRSIR
jgi:hypothetical protein